MNKRFIYIFLTGSIVVFGGFVFVVYLFFFADEPRTIFKNIRLFFSSKEEVVEEKTLNDEKNIPSIKKMSNHPIVEGGFFFINDEENRNYILHISKQKGEIYKTNLKTTSTSLVYENKDSFLTDVFKADWLNKNSIMIHQLVDGNKVNISLIHLHEENKVSNATKTDLPQKTSFSVNSSNKKSFFYLVEKEGGVEGFIGTVDSSGRISERGIFSSPIKEWLGNWSSENIINLTTKPSGYVPGHMYSINSIDGSISHTLRNVPGLVTKTNKAGSLTIYNQSSEDGFTLMLFDHRNNTKRKVDNVNTLVDKCVWKNENVIICAIPKDIPPSVYPDDWYQGKISFEDLYLKKINLKTKESLILFNFKEKGVDFDSVNLVFDDIKESVFFIDKKTGLLWLYQDDNF